jgi:hypothetical protein
MTPLRALFSRSLALALLRRPLLPKASQRRDQVREALRRDLEAARYAADRAFRQYDAADPANRLVAGELEARWNKALARVAEVEAKIAAHDAATVPSTVDCAFKHSARNLPLKDSMKALSVGLPGREKSSVTPR